VLPPGTIRARRGVPATIALRGLLAGCFFGVEAVVPLSLTVQHSFNATEAGLPLACSGVTWAFGSWLQGRDVAGDEQERRVRLARYGFSLIALGTVGVAICALTPAGWLIYPAWALAGAGAGMTMSTLSVLMLRFTNDRDRGFDSAALQLSDVASGAVTTGLAGVLVATASRGTIGYATAFAVLDVAMVCVAVVGVGAATRLRRPE
jgi:sugar phosphate permease